MRLWFQEGSDPRDFEAFGDLPEWWNATDEERDEMFVRFKAYSTAGELCLRESSLRANGYELDCYVDLQREPVNGPFEEWELANFPARNRKEAERLLQVAADALYGEER